MAWEAVTNQAKAPILRFQLDYSAHRKERYRWRFQLAANTYLLSPKAVVTPSEMLVLTSRASSQAHIFRTISIMRTPLMLRKSMIAISPIKFQIEYGASFNGAAGAKVGAAPGVIAAAATPPPNEPTCPSIPAVSATNPPPPARAPRRAGHREAGAQADDQGGHATEADH